MLQVIGGLTHTCSHPPTSPMATKASTVVSHVGGRPFWMKNFKCIFLVSLASLGAERSGKIDFRTPEAQKTEKMLSQMGSYVHFTV